MNNQKFWHTIAPVIDDGFAPEGINTLEQYAEQFLTHQLIYQRYTLFEQHGCTEGGTLHVIASILAGAETSADQLTAH